MRSIGRCAASNVMRNLAVHGERRVDSARAEEFLALAEAMRVVLEITEPGAAL